jgi:DNA-directed RNA polymerase specialized sigma24 family protein
MNKQDHSSFGKTFATTCWTDILIAKGENASTPLTDEPQREALGRLIEAYWAPLYVFARRKGHDMEKSQDLVQDFFATFLEKDYLRYVDRGRGRFRSFLLIAFKRFLIDDFQRAHTRKRTWPETHFNFPAAENCYNYEPVTTETAETIYLRAYARQLALQALDMLQREYASEGQAELFKAIAPFLTSNEEYEHLASLIRVPLGTARVKVHRARRRYAELLRNIVRNTLIVEADTDDELRELRKLL